MGSGTTGIAAISLGRKFIGIEKDQEKFSIAKKRLLEQDNIDINRPKFTGSELESSSVNTSTAADNDNNQNNTVLNGVEDNGE